MPGVVVGRRRQHDAARRRHADCGVPGAVDGAWRGAGNGAVAHYQVTPGYRRRLACDCGAGGCSPTPIMASGTRAWIVNEEFARLYLPPDPLGYRFEQKTGRPAPSPIEIVGIVGNVLKDGNDRKPQPEVYVMPRDQRPVLGTLRNRVARVGQRRGAGPGTARAVRELEPTAAVETVALSQRVAASVDQPRFATAVLGDVRHPRARARVGRAVRRAVVQRVAAAPRARRARGARRGEAGSRASRGARGARRHDDGARGGSGGRHLPDAPDAGRPVRSQPARSRGLRRGADDTDPDRRRGLLAPGQPGRQTDPIEALRSE